MLSSIYFLPIVRFRQITFFLSVEQDKGKFNFNQIEMAIFNFTKGKKKDI